jgi:hypothetical protein
MRYKRAMNERNREVADRLGVLLEPGAAGSDSQSADVVEIGPREISLLHVVARRRSEPQYGLWPC